MEAEDKFIRIAITPPGVNATHISKGVMLLQSGEIDILHLRAPEADEARMRALVALIPDELRSRVTLHSHFGLIEEYSLGGAHLNHRNPIPPAYPCRLSISCHSEDDILLAADARFDYATLSPVFDSISKQGYQAVNELLELPRFLNIKGIELNVIALGGVTPDAFPLLKSKGFAGAAMLGFYFPT